MHEYGNGSSFEALFEDNAPAKSSNHGWQTVVNPKRQRKQQGKEANSADPNKAKSNGDGKSIFQSLELHAEERRKRAEEQRAAAASALSVGQTNGKIGASDEDSEEEAPNQSGAVDGEEKKVKQKKPKKPKVTVAEAAAKIDPSNLADFLVEITGSYEKAPDVQLMRFADYFARAFSSVTSAQFPLNKMLKESTVAKLAEMPLCYIPEVVRKTSADWINQQPTEELSKFSLWAFSSVLEDIGTQGGHKGSKQAAQPVAVKTKVALFVVLAMVLRRRPDIMLQLSPALKTESKFQGQDRLPMIVWSIAQACQADLVIGTSLWVQNLLPLAVGKTSTPLSRDLTLQLIESCILQNTKARPILLNGAIRKGERIVPPNALNLLMQAAFPLDSARTKGTDRFVAIYPFLKELALTGSNRSKATRPVAQQLLPLMATTISEENPALTNEAAGIFIWCLTQNSDCYKQWEKLHIEHIKASTIILGKLSADWKNNVERLRPLLDLKRTLKSLRSKNEHALEGEDGDARLQASVKAADKYCKILLGRLSRTAACLKITTMTALMIVLIAFFVMLALPSMESGELKKISQMFSDVFSRIDIQSKLFNLMN